MPAERIVVLNADGTVLGVDGAPADWTGTRLEERTDVPDDVRRAVANARSQFSSGATPLSVTEANAQTAQSLRVVVLSALPVRRVATDLRALLESTINVMQQQARGMDVTLTLDVAPDVPRLCQLDTEKIAWTITTLVGNALRFVRRGTRLMPGGAIRVQARFDPATSQLILEVQDDGSGIPKDKAAQLLQKGPGQIHAAGLALSLIQDVVAAHGGDVHIESSTEVGRSGTTVRLTLPGR
jgi:signal transduction histidine kinase